MQLIQCGLYYNEHLVWSDECATQFKLKNIWYHIVRYMFAKTFDLLRIFCHDLNSLNFVFAICIISLVIKFQIIICGCRYRLKTKGLVHLPHGCRMVWSYFGNGHGNGVYDGTWAMLK